MTRRSLIRRAGVVVAALLAAITAPQLADAQDVQVDTALIVSIDVSNSVDADRYKLQMEGIAKALEDPGVIDAIVSGPNGGILFAMVTWADRPQIALPWTKISSKQDALALAARVRKLPLQGGEFTCMTKMLRSVNDKIVPQIPARALRVVVDVSGDGPDNCNAEESIETVRDELVSNNVTINGLPILEGANAAGSAGDKGAAAAGPQGSLGLSGNLEEWFKAHVQGGNGSFVLPANGYSDFARAIRQKFVIEISGKVLPRTLGARSIDERFVTVERGVETVKTVAPSKIE